MTIRKSILLLAFACALSARWSLVDGALTQNDEGRYRKHAIQWKAYTSFVCFNTHIYCLHLDIYYDL